ncbi:MAG: F0F1 ATP synthase subunit epsilon [Chitinivibrionales bacterium]|nr:F0F1 ATP synthase subunit epsilon [Chitinivibrionales bacterium]
MKLTIMIPTGVIYDKQIKKVTVETNNGRYTLLPNHIDFITLVVPGIIDLEQENNSHVFIAADEGVLVKQKDNVWVSLRNAVKGGELGSLQTTVDEHYRTISEKEQKNRTSIARLERDMAQSIYEFEKAK